MCALRRCCCCRCNSMHASSRWSGCPRTTSQERTTPNPNSTGSATTDQCAAAQELCAGKPSTTTDPPCQGTRWVVEVWCMPNASVPRAAQRKPHTSFSRHPREQSPPGHARLTRNAHLRCPQTAPTQRATRLQVRQQPKTDQTAPGGGKPPQRPYVHAGTRSRNGKDKPRRDKLE